MASSARTRPSLRVRRAVMLVPTQRSSRASFLSNSSRSRASAARAASLRSRYAS
jgi:hypothetical protein